MRGRWSGFLASVACAVALTLLVIVSRGVFLVSLRAVTLSVALGLGVFGYAPLIYVGFFNGEAAQREEKLLRFLVSLVIGCVITGVGILYSLVVSERSFSFDLGYALFLVLLFSALCFQSGVYDSLRGFVFRKTT
jgi:hypothetical protein